MIIRTEHTEDYLMVSNSVIRDARLSIEARGFLLYLLSMSDDWKFSVNGLSYATGLSESKVTALTQELKNAGYVFTKKVKDERGRFGSYEWTVYERPVLAAFTEQAKNRTSEKPNLENSEPRKNRTSEKPSLGKSGDIRITNNKELPKSKEGPKNKRVFGEFQNVLLSDSEFANLRLRFGDQERGERIEDLSRYLAQHPKKKYASHYATILAWARKDQRDTSVTAIPHTEDGIDWDRIARLAEEQFTSTHGGNNT